MARKYTKILSFVCFFVMYQSTANAQDYSPRNIPVLKVDADLNGVDTSSGAYSIRSPFGFNVPGAGHLNAELVYNGRKYTTTINTYLEDQTLTRPDYGDPFERQIRIHSGGIDRMFVCASIGECSEVGKTDGSILNRTDEKSYEFVDGTGMRVTFFPMSTQEIYPVICTDIETGCNAAKYFGYAYASTIAYPSGERIKFANFQTASAGNFILTAESNLGYSMDIIFPCATTCFIETTYPGAIWLQERYGLYKKTYQIRKGSTILKKISFDYNQVKVNTVPQAGKIAMTQSVVISDDLARTFRIDSVAKWVGNCGTILTPDGNLPANINLGGTSGSFDGTTFFPVKVTSPGGTVIDIGYYDVWVYTQELNLTPVASVTRGGKRWKYDYTVNSILTNTNSLLETDPTDRTHSKTTQGYTVPWDTIWGFNSNWCGNSTLGSDVTKDIDGLGRKIEFSYISQSVLESVTKPEKNGYTYTPDLRGNILTVVENSKSQSGLSPRIVYKASYDAVCGNPLTCNQPNWTQDAQGAQTEYEYDPAHGGVTKITLPAGTDGVRPQRWLFYQAISTSNGTIYRLVSESECITGSACIGLSTERLKNYTYFENTFLKSSETAVLGDGNSVSKVLFEYDARGLMTKETGPSGQSTYFLYDAAGRKVGEIGPDPDGSGPLLRPAVRNTYSADDQLLEREEGTAVGTTAGDLASMIVNKFTRNTYDPGTGLLVKTEVVQP